MFCFHGYLFSIILFLNRNPLDRVGYGPGHFARMLFFDAGINRVVRLRSGGP